LLSIANTAAIRLFARSGYIQEIVENIADRNRPAGAVASAADRPLESPAVTDGACQQTSVTS
jgi:hypothetical protein